MKLYNAYIKNAENGAIDDLVLIKNGTSYLALFFSAIWFLYHKMWKEFLVLAIIIFALMQVKNIAESYIAIFIVLFVISLIIAVNANYWYGQYLQKRNYNFSGCVFGKNKEMAKLRFIEGHLENHPRDAILFSDSILNPKNKSKMENYLFS